MLGKTKVRDHLFNLKGAGLWICRGVEIFFLKLRQEKTSAFRIIFLPMSETEIFVPSKVKWTVHNAFITLCDCDCLCVCMRVLICVFSEKRNF